jgi:hypothetical protein
MKLETSVAVASLVIGLAVAGGEANARTGCETAQRTAQQRARQPKGPIEIVNLYNPRSERRAANPPQAEEPQPEPAKASFYDEYYAYRLGYAYGYGGYGYGYGYVPVVYDPGVFGSPFGFGRHDGLRDGRFGSRGGFRLGADKRSGTGVSSGFGPGNNLSFAGGTGFGPGNNFAFGGGPGVGPQKFVGVGPQRFVGVGFHGGSRGGRGMGGGRR